MSAALIHGYLRASGLGSQPERVGPFVALFTPDSDHPMRNYAIPDDDAQPTGAEVEALVRVFEERGLRPRLEYAPDAAPRLESILFDAGFEVEGRHAVMTCRPDQAVALEGPGDFAVGLAGTDRDHVDAMVVADIAYGEAGPPPNAAAVAARRRLVDAGGAVVLARHRATGRPAGSGLVQIPRAAVSELAAVGTHPEFRNRGVAAAVTARLIGAAFGGGIELVWLTAEDVNAERIYARAGFVSDGLTMVHLSRPAREKPVPGAERVGPPGAA